MAIDAKPLIIKSGLFRSYVILSRATCDFCACAMGVRPSVDLKLSLMVVSFLQVMCCGMYRDLLDNPVGSVPRLSPLAVGHMTFM